MSKVKCIVVEDEPLAVKVLTDYISQIPFLELQATFKDAIMATEWLRNNSTDLIFLDINMPVIDGRETLRRIRRIRQLAEVPVYMLSTTMDNDELESYRRIGATSCFTKPKTFEELCLMLADVLKKW